MTSSLTMTEELPDIDAPPEPLVEESTPSPSVADAVREMTQAERPAVNRILKEPKRRRLSGGGWAVWL